MLSDTSADREIAISPKRSCRRRGAFGSSRAGDASQASAEGFCGRKKRHPRSPPAREVMKPRCLPPICSACTAATPTCMAGKPRSFPSRRTAWAATRGKSSPRSAGKGVFARLKYNPVCTASSAYRSRKRADASTSAATVAVLPEAEDIDIDIKPEDIRIDTMRMSSSLMSMSAVLGL